MHSFVVIIPFREFEQQRELRERGLQSTSDESAARKISSSEDAIIDHMDKVNACLFCQLYDVVNWLWLLIEYSFFMNFVW